MRWKIGCLTYALDRTPAGIGAYTRQLLAALRQYGQPHTILQAGGGLQSQEVTHLWGAALLPALLTLGQMEIAWLAWREGLDLLHDPTGVAPLSLAPTRRVVTLCDTFPFVKPGTSALLERWIYRYWLPHVLPRVDAFITISQQSKADIVRFLPIRAESITVTPLAASHRFCPLPEERVKPVLERLGLSHPYILYVGSIEPRKNLLRLIEAYTHLRAWSTRWELVIVGARNLWKSSPVAQKVQYLGLQDCVRFTGYVPDEDLPALYNGAALFAFPSLYEGFGLPVLEAMACGTPVVTSNSSSLPEVAGEAALLVDPYDVEAIAIAMQRLLEDPDLAEEYRQRGLARATEFSWERTARETIAVYERVLGNSRGKGR